MTAPFHAASSQSRAEAKANDAAAKLAATIIIFMTLTLVSPKRRDRLLDQQHLVLPNVSWAFYEQVLEELGDRPTRVTYWHGSIEMMAPLAEHEMVKKAIARLIEALAVEANLSMLPYGSTTFRREDREGGLEPDECYYLKNAGRVRGMKKFDPEVHPPPDLAIEIDITRRSIPRQPIYADLGVPELWRHDGIRFSVLHLRRDGKYRAASKSVAFPFLPIGTFAKFIKRMLAEDQTTVVREFQAWVRTLVS